MTVDQNISSAATLTEGDICGTVIYAHPKLTEENESEEKEEER
jgi:hypothetical protein